MNKVNDMNNMNDMKDINKNNVFDVDYCRGTCVKRLQSLDPTLVALRSTLISFGSIDLFDQLSVGSVHWYYSVGTHTYFLLLFAPRRIMILQSIYKQYT